MRRLARLLVILIASAAALIGAGHVASAAPCASDPRNPGLCTNSKQQPVAPPATASNPIKGVDSCGPLGGHSKVPPPPAMPGDDGAGWLATQPKPSTATFGTSTTPDQIYSLYGLASYEWHTYDLGCPGDPSNISQSTVHRVVDYTSSIIQGINTVGAAVVSAVLAAVLNPTWLGVLDPLLAKVSKAFAPIFHNWAPVSVAILAILIIWRAFPGGGMRKTAADVFAALVILGVALTTIAFPTLVTHQVDNIIKTGASTAASAVGATSGSTASSKSPADVIIGKFTGDILFTQWVQGELGTTTGSAATHNNNAMRLWDGSHFTLAEAETINSGGDSDHHIEKAKAIEYASAAADVGSTSSSAYNNLQGTNNNRIMIGILTAVSMIAAFTFLLAACLLVIIAFLTIRLLTMMIPILALIGIVPAGRDKFKAAMERGAKAVVDALVFFAAALLNMVLVGVVMSPTIGLNGAMRIVLCAAFSVILWGLLKPHRKALHTIHKMTKKVTDPVKDSAEFAAGAVITGGAAAAGMYAMDRHAAGRAPDVEEAAQPRGEAWLRYDHPAPEHAEIEKAPQPAIEAAPDTTPTGEPDMPINPVYTTADDPDLDVGDYAPSKQKVYSSTAADQPEPEITLVEDEGGTYYDPADDSASDKVAVG